MSRRITVDDVHILLTPPTGFVDVTVVYPSFLEEYRREQDVLAAYIEECHADASCSEACHLLDPFVEVVIPEEVSVMRQVSPHFFETCKFEVAQAILNFSVPLSEAETTHRTGPLPPLGTFVDGPGWFSCCTLRYREACCPDDNAFTTSEVTRRDKSSVTRGFSSCLIGNIVFLVGELPVIVNIHRSLDTRHPADSFAWLVGITESYCKILLPLNGIM